MYILHVNTTKNVESQLARTKIVVVVCHNTEKSIIDTNISIRFAMNVSKS